MTLSGGRNDTVMDNTFSDNGAWGFLVVPYPDSGTPSLGQRCPATGGVEVSGLGCVYDPEGDALVAQHLQPQRLLRQSQQLGLRPDRLHRRSAPELLLREHGPQRQCPAGSGADPAHLREDHHGGQYRRPAPRPGALRFGDRVQHVPGRVRLSRAHRGGHAPATEGPAHHARSVRRRARQPVVPGRKADLSPGPPGHVRDLGPGCRGRPSRLLMRLLVDQTGQVCQAWRRWCGTRSGDRRPEPAPRRPLPCPTGDSKPARSMPEPFPTPPPGPGPFPSTRPPATPSVTPPTPPPCSGWRNWGTSTPAS